MSNILDTRIWIKVSFKKKSKLSRHKTLYTKKDRKKEKRWNSPVSAYLQWLILDLCTYAGIQQVPGDVQPLLLHRVVAHCAHHHITGTGDLQLHTATNGHTGVVCGQGYPDGASPLLYVRVGSTISKVSSLFHASEYAA